MNNATLDHYCTAFRTLRVDRARTRHLAATNHAAPHKPFLLLAVMDLIAQDVITSNVVELNADLLDTFKRYWQTIVGTERDGNIALPFYHLKSDGFWHLVAVPGHERALAVPLRSLAQLHANVLGATLDDELYALLLQPATRDALRQVLIEHWFAPETRPHVVAVGTITAQSFAYSRALLQPPRAPFRLEEHPADDEQYTAEARSTGFRRAIVTLYNHTCAMCQLRVVTPEGYSAVEAAHIVPWHVSRNDNPRNGLALCGVHHWAFDNGLLGIDADSLHIVVSPVVASDDPATAAFRLLAGQLLRVPSEQAFVPSPRALAWHQREVYRREVPLRLF